jgi:predicted Fe-Mo cluster-binding NifX family protein
MQELVVAIPSNQPGGLESLLDAHFGHCDLYTLVKIADNKIQNIFTLPNAPHQQGGCLAPVTNLARYGVKVLIAGGIGLRPLMGFNQAGIEVLHSGGARTVGEAVNLLLNNSLPRFTQNLTCGGGDCAHNDKN